MPRTRKPRHPSYRHHKPSGQAVVTLNGKDHYLGPYGSDLSRQDYDRLIGLWLANGRQLPGGTDGPADLTIVEMLAAYGGHAERYYRKNGRPTGTLRRIQRIIDQLNRLYGRTLAADFGPRDLKALREHLIRSDLSRTTINQYISAVRSMFAWAVENEMVPSGAYHALMAVKGLRKHRSEARETEPVKPVPVGHVDVIKPYVSRQVWAMIQVQLLTGCRPGEARLMHGCDLDMTGRLWEYRPVEHKSEHHDKNACSR